MSQSPLEFAKTLVEHRVLEPGQLDDLQPYLAKHKDVGALVKDLLEWGWLTPYQAECALSGNSAALLFGDYRLLEPLGQGGMGQVFKAAHLRLGRIVAIKMIRPQSLKASDFPKELIRRFHREAQAVAQLLHTNIVILFDYNEINGTPFIAMEYVDGVDLAKMVQTQGPLAIPHACDFVRQTALGLQHAHEYGMVHRDIKPANLLVTRPSIPSNRVSKPGRLSGLIPRPAKSGTVPRPGDTPMPTIRLSNPGGVVKILDMGLVRMNETIEGQDTFSDLTMQGTVIGTPDYIAPEQARDASKVDIRADLYSLGCTFYFLLTGRPPFPEGTSVEKLFKHQNENPKISVEEIRPGTPVEVMAIVMRLMSKRPEARFQTPADLADAIGALPTDLLTGRAKMDSAGKLVAAVAELVQAERGQTQVAVPTQFFPADTLVLPAKKIAVIKGHTGYVTATEFSPDGRFLGTGGIDGTLHIWDVGMARPSEKNLDQNANLGELTHLKFGPGGRSLFAGSTAMDGHNWRWDWTAPTQNVRRKLNDDYRTSCFAVSPDGTTLAAGSQAAVLIYDLSGTKRPTVIKGHVGEVRALIYSANGKRLFSAGQDKTIRLWEPGRFWSSKKATYEGHADTILCLALSPDGSLLASASHDGTIRLWDASGENSECVAVLSGHLGGVRHVRFTANGDTLLSVADDGRVNLWEVTESCRVREWQIDRTMMYSVTSSGDCRYVATGLSDGQVAFYDLELLVGLDKPQMQMAGV